MPESAYAIAPAGDDGVNGAHGVHTACFPPHAADFLNREAFKAIAGAPGAEMICARDKGERVCGYVLYRAGADEAEILSLGVVSACRRRGIARLLCQAVFEALRAQGVSRIFLEVGVKNAPGKALYASLGFREAGVRQGYYRHKNGEIEDALIMNINLVN